MYRYFVWSLSFNLFGLGGPPPCAVTFTWWGCGVPQWLG